MCLLREEAFGIEGGHTPRAGRCDSLAVDVILDVAGGEDAGDVRLRRARLRDEIPGLVVVEPVEEQCRGRVVAEVPRAELSVRRLTELATGASEAEPGAAS